ncbi:MAG: sulfatase [Planctomycetota bacterium]|jgi:arylsulfatase A-like enzyme
MSRSRPARSAAAAPARRPGRAATCIALLGALAALCCLPACTDPVPSGRFAVVTRAFEWSAETDSVLERVPLSRTWEFTAEQPDWTVTAGQGHLEDGALVLRGKGRVALSGPGTGVLDAEILQWLTLRVEADSGGQLEMRWRGGAPFVHQLAPGAQGEDLTVALASLESVNHRASAPDLSLAFLSDDQGPLVVRVMRIGVVSDFDHDEARGFSAGRHERGHILRSGIAARAPGTLRARVTARDGDRLRFALAAVGGTRPVDVVLSSAGGGLPEQTFACPPAGPWTEHAIDLPAPPSGGAWDLGFRLQAPADSTAVVLIGSPMLLRRMPDRQPDVVLYVEDTLRADRLGSYGYALPTDPHLATIAAQGTTFERVWSSTNWTRPALSSLLTGLDTVAHGNRHTTWRVPDALETLAETLAREGWITASFVTNHHGGSWAGLDQGFDAHADPDAFGAPALSSTLTSALIHEPIAAFLAEHADERVFVFAHSLDPHAPYEADAESLAALRAAGVPRPEVPDDHPDARRIRHSTRQYDGEVRHNDGLLARLDETLGARASDDGTLFVFVSDHGEAFHEHGQWEHRRTLHEEEVRVPWILSWPGEVAPGARLELPVSLVDVAPTMLGLLGLARPADWQGRDLAAACRGERPPPLAPLFLDSLRHQEDGSFAHDAAVVLWPHKLLLDVDADGEPRPIALYRLDVDPMEREDLLPEEAGGTLVPALVDLARGRLQAGPLVPEGEARAKTMSPALEEWMRQMGYLR